MKKRIPVIIEEDFLLANAYLYYAKNSPVVTDAAYDVMEKGVLHRYQCKSRGELPSGEFKRILGSENSEDYPPHIRALGLYLALKFSAKSGAKKVDPRLAKKFVLKKRKV